MKLTRTTRNAGWLVVAGLLAAALIAPTGAAAASFHGAIWTSLSDGGTVNANRYDNKSDVYLNGGPQNCGGNGLPDGSYYFQVTNPSGATLLSTDAIKFRQVEVVGGVISGTSGAGNHEVGAGGCPNAMPVQLMPYADTPNNGGEYSVDMAPKAEVDACEGFDPDSTTFNFVKDCNVASKNDNFKVGAVTTTTTTTTADETTTTTADETTTTTSSVDTVTTTSVTGTVSGETGKSKPTPPSTDADFSSTTSSTTGGGWSLLLLAMAGLLAAALLLTPAAEARKR
jgi:hypothetical protein